MAWDDPVVVDQPLVVGPRWRRALESGPRFVRFVIRPRSRAAFDDRWQRQLRALLDGATDRRAHRVVVRDYMQYWLEAIGIWGLVTMGVCFGIPAALGVDIYGDAGPALFVVWACLFVPWGAWCCVLSCSVSRLSFARRRNRLASL